MAPYLQEMKSQGSNTSVFLKNKRGLLVKGSQVVVIIILIAISIFLANFLTGNYYSYDNIIPSRNLPSLNGATRVSNTNGEALTDTSTAKENEVKSSGLKIPILYYHYIEVNPNPIRDPGRNSLLITPENFLSQMIYLKNAGYTSITYDDLLSGFKNAGTLPSKPIIITVDDGYTDFFSNAFPILKKLNIKATVFVLSQGGKIKPGFYMSDNQIKELSQSPLITVGCHTEDHMDLKGRSETLQRKEIFGCKKQLESLIGMTVRHFAYPYGAYDPTTIRLVKEAGFETASTTNPGSYQSQNTPYTLKRIRVGNYDGSGLKSILSRYP
jgi:peptidoglycan/xylan/chitin deacetylase (PgdA/CDA1 family)